MGDSNVFDPQKFSSKTGNRTLLILPELSIPAHGFNYGILNVCNDLQPPNILVRLRERRPSGRPRTLSRSGVTESTKLARAPSALNHSEQRRLLGCFWDAPASISWLPLSPLTSKS